MPGTKRKASFAFPYERPSKITKRTSSTTVSRTLSTITKKTSVVKPPLKMPKFPSLRASKMDNITEESASAPLSDDGGSPTPPALRRASTLTLDDDSTRDSAKTALTKRKSSASKPASLSKKSSSFVEEGALVTKLSGLRSGSIVGETSLAASTSMTKMPSVSKSLSRKSSSVKSTDSSSRIPSLPSGLTKLALPKSGSKSGSLHISKSTLVSDIDETEMSSALDSLKTHLSKEGSTKGSMSKSASVRSTFSVKKTTESDKGEDMDTTTAGPSSDGLMEVAISFDTTGSMYGCLEEVRAKVQDLVQRLQTDIPGIRVAVIAHGDYCDESNYVIKWIDFGATLPEICDFVKNVGRTGGGDGPECYELVLQRSREVLSWTDGSKRILVMISDDVPHEPGYTYGGKTYYINWRDECAALKEMGVKVYGVQAGYGGTAATHFNDEMARITGGKRLSLKNFSCIFDVLMMICYREGNPEMLAIYEQEIIDRGERMAEDITSLKKTFDMASTVTSAVTHTTKRVGKIGAAKVKRAAKKLKPKADKIKVASTALKKNKTKIGKKTGPKKQIKGTHKTVTVKKRENLPDSCMNKDALKNLTWTKWICGVEPKMPTNKQKSKFEKLRTNQGYGPKSIFDGNYKLPAIYEFAVQIPGSRKKYVVYFRMSKGGFRRSGLWATNLLRHKKVRQEVNSVLNQGCSIYIRRGVPKAKATGKKRSQMQSANDYIRDNFDYAWKKYIWRRSEDAVSKFGLKHRLIKLTRKGNTFTISDNKT
ncbi:uncharacterized protein LOC123529987 [Mercenaria mercenaria]|uniref:uncharacterized protein LOC123529987 n=1 Tax=Mercenaria mercenaria TaxID=6596 RepID=UPI00234E7E2C|nr:uncharacterized protein LOC123529987 [Mercenaria mercenaria]